MKNNKTFFAILSVLGMSLYLVNMAKLEVDSELYIAVQSIVWFMVALYALRKIS